MRHLVLLLVFIGSQAGAKTKIDVSPFANKTNPGPCNLVEPWQKDIEQNFKFQLSNALTQSGHFNVVESEVMRGEERAKLFDSGVSTMHKKSTFKASQYSVVGVLKSFDACPEKAEVVLEIVVLDKDGDIQHKFTSAGHARGQKISSDVKGAAFSSGLFKDSAIGRATVEAIADAAGKLKRAFPERDVASDDYKVRTIRRSRSR